MVGLAAVPISMATETSSRRLLPVPTVMLPAARLLALVLPGAAE